MTKEEIRTYLTDNGWRPFYSDNNWIYKNGSDYSGVTMCQAYCMQKYGESDLNKLFDKTMELEYTLNRDKKLGVVGKTYEFKDELKKEFKAKWHPKKRLWVVPSFQIKNRTFHDYCYAKNRNFRFTWI